MSFRFDFNYEKYTLANGLEVILYPDSQKPAVSVNICYKVGSANEIKGKTGFAHLFEHLMFQGSKNVPKGGHFRYIEDAGGNLNGGTGFDYTHYYQTVPPDSLELVLWLESDRMGQLLPALDEEKLQNQIDVVINERAERYDNAPYGTAFETLLANLHDENHPYHSPVIGFSEDIRTFTLNEVKLFFENYYSPANASIVVAGSFDPGSARKLIEQYFGGITGTKNILGENLIDRKKISYKIIEKRENVNLPRIHLAWRSDKIFGENDASLDVLSHLLTETKSSRLKKRLIYDDQISLDVSSAQFSGLQDGSFFIISTAKQGVDPQSLHDIILGELSLLKKDGIRPDELSKAINNIKSGYIYSLMKLSSIAQQFNLYNYFLGNPDMFNFDISRYENLSIESLMETLDKFLNDCYIDLRILPNE